MTSGIKLNIAFNDADDLPSAGPVASQIAAIPGLLGWFQADPLYTTIVSGGIDVFADRAGGANTFSKTSVNGRAVLTADQINGFYAADFDPGGAGVDRYTFTGATFNANAAFTWVVVFRVDDTTADRNVLAVFTDASNKASINTGVGASTFRFQYGGGVGITAPVTVGQWHAAICSFDGTLMKMWADGNRLTDSDVTGTGGTASLVLGALNTAGAQGLDGAVSDALIFTGDLLDAENAAYFTSLRDYIKNVYDIG